MRNLIFLFIIPFLSFSQEKINLTGLILDAESSEKLSFASVSLLSNIDDKIIDGSISDIDGIFKIININENNFRLRIEYIGYDPNIINFTDLNKKKIIKINDNVFTDIGVFYLNKSSQKLDEIELVDEKPLMVQGIDKKIFNVGQDITSSGGTAAELMERLPSVEVDMDGNLSLRGSDQVRLFVDGKPSLLTSSELLETIPAAMIESIELITNPSAKYSPEGMAGIINVILKKNKKIGLNGNLNSSFSYPYRTNFTSLINRRTKKSNIFVSYTLLDQFSSYIVERKKETYFENDTFNLIQDRWGEENEFSHTFKSGFDLNPNETLNITLQGKYNIFNSDEPDTIFYDETTFSDQIIYYRITNTKSERNNWNIDLNFNKKWKNSLKMDGLLDISENINNRSDIFYDQLILNTNDSITQISTNRKNNQIESRIDFIFGDEEIFKLEFGIGYRFREMNQNIFLDSTEINGINQAILVDNSNLFNHFNFQDIILSSYLTFSKKITPWSMMIGIRPEQAYVQSFLIDDDSNYKSNYFKIYPSLFLNYSLDEYSSVQSSYTRRVNRPKFWNLNPFPSYSDPYTLRMGNPFLKPEFVNSYEIGYQKFKRGSTFTTSIYVKDIKDVQQRFVSVDSNNVTTISWQNLNDKIDIGFEIMVSKKFFNSINFMISSNIYYSKIDASNLTSEFNNSFFGMRSNYNLSWKKKNHKIQLSGFVSPAANTTQGRLMTMYSSDLAYSKSILNDKGKFIFRVSDIFNTRFFGYRGIASNFDESVIYDRLSRFFSLSFNYNFGDQNKQNKKSKKYIPRNGSNNNGNYF